MDENSGAAADKRRRLAMMALSLGVSLLLAALKFSAFLLTGSSAILSDALESIINVAAGGFGLWSVYIASKPPDAGHPYGHGEIEYFSAGFEGALIVLASGVIVWEAANRLVSPIGLPKLDLGLIILGATALANLWLGLTLIRAGKKMNSAAISADGNHVLTDVYTSGGVIAGLLLVRLTGWYFLDGAVAFLVAANIVFIGFKLIFMSSSRLMRAYDPELLRRITSIIAQNRKTDWIHIHRLRAWSSGREIHMDFHLVLPRDLSLEDAHHEVVEVQQLLKSQLPGAEDVMIHVEPCTDPECPICSRAPCRVRGKSFRDHPDLCPSEVAYPGGKDSGAKPGPGE
ncbi:MAG: cation diffusion facilitator family transporter [Syntrophobacteraceae bacterium]|nr:cation diffusion facilitator family transporter [Syntrophobacteraceae bacterium]